MSFWVGLLVILSLGFSLSVLFAAKPAYSIFTAFCLMIAVLTVGGIFNQLFLATLLFMLASAAAFFRAATKKLPSPKAERFKSFFLHPVVIIFVLSVGIVSVIFALQKPAFYYWDEFAFWGMAAKVTKMSNLLYTVAPSNMISNVTPCGSIVLSYFFQFFRNGFSESTHYLSGVALCFSAYALVAQLVWERTKSLPQTAAANIVLFFIPMFFGVTGRMAGISDALPVYTTAMVDLQITLCFVAVLVMYLLHPEKKWFFAPLLVLPLAKDIGMVMGMLAAGIITVLFVLDSSRRKEYRLRKLKQAPAALVTGGAAILTPFIVYMGWTIYISLAFSRNQFQLGGAENMGMATMLVSGLKELFVPSLRSEKFSTIFGSMLRHFLTVKSSLLGSAAVGVALLLLLLALVFVLAQKKDRRQVAYFTIFSLAGFVAYVIFLGFTYVYVFRGTEGYDLADYDRYLNTYLLGWVITAAAFAVAYIRPKAAVLLKVGLPAAALATVAVYFYFIGPAHSFVGANNFKHHYRYDITRPAVQALQNTNPQDKIFVVAQGQDGMASLYLSFDLYPQIINGVEEGYGDTVGTIALPGTDTGSPYTVFLSVRDFADLLQNGYSYLYISHADEVFVEQYGELFSDGLRGYQQGGTALYRVAAMQQDGFVLVPAAEEGE